MTCGKCNQKASSIELYCRSCGADLQVFGLEKEGDAGAQGKKKGKEVPPASAAAQSAPAPPVQPSVAPETVSRKVQEVPLPSPSAPRSPMPSAPSAAPPQTSVFPPAGPGAGTQPLSPASPGVAGVRPLGPQSPKFGIRHEPGRGVPSQPPGSSQPPVSSEAPASVKPQAPPVPPAGKPLYEKFIEEEKQ